MEPREQQEQELEILQAAYPEEVEVLNGEYPDVHLRVTVPSVPKWDNPEPDFYVEIDVRLPADYPNVAPEFELSGFPVDFPNSHVQEIYNNMRSAAENMLGFQVVITLISEVQRAEKEEEERARLAQEAHEEAERKRFEGNRVTTESFLTWKTQFEKEFLAAEILAKKARESALAGKLTGKQQFLRDASLIMSDLGIMDKPDEAPEEEEDEGDDVEIDQALFEEELSDLDISDGETTEA